MLCCTMPATLVQLCPLLLSIYGHFSLMAATKCLNYSLLGNSISSHFHFNVSAVFPNVCLCSSQNIHIIISNAMNYVKTSMWENSGTNPFYTVPVRIELKYAYHGYTHQHSNWGSTPYTPNGVTPSLHPDCEPTTRSTYALVLQSVADRF